MLLPITAMLVFTGTPLGKDLCRHARADIQLASQNGLDLARPPLRREGGFIFRDVVAYEGEPIVVHVRAGVVLVSPPRTGITVEVFKDDAMALTIHFAEWTQHASPDAGSEPYFAAPEYRGTIQPLPAGVYVFKAIPLGCGHERWRETEVHRPRLTVRRLSAPEDRAQLRMYRAKRAAFWHGDCHTALQELADVDAFDPEAFMALSLRAECAREARKWEDALQYYEKLQSKLESERRASGLGLHLRGFDDRIAEIRAVLRGQRREPAAKEKP